MDKGAQKCEWKGAAWGTPVFQFCGARWCGCDCLAQPDRNSARQKTVWALGAGHRQEPALRGSSGRSDSSI